MANSHRNTLKHDHKPFKSKHATKGQIKARIKGKVEKSSNSSGGSKSSKVVSKLERKNLSKQQRDNKILETKLTKKLFEGNSGAEKIVTIITLTNDLSAVDIANRLFNEQEDTSNESITRFGFGYPSVTNINIAKFKTNLKVIIPKQNNMISILDAAQVSDFVLLGISATEEIGENSFGETVLRALIAQGISTTIGVLPNIVSAYPKRNLQLDVKQSLQSFYHHFFPSRDGSSNRGSGTDSGGNKLYSLELDSDNSNCLRIICQKFPQSITWRDSRGWLVADKVEIFNPNDMPVENQQQMMVVEGMVRGVGFNVNRLVHLPGLGDFQLHKLEKLARKARGNSSRNHRGGMDIDTGNDGDAEETFLPNEQQESLDELNPDEGIDMGTMEDDDDFLNNDNFGVRSEGKIYFDNGNSNGTGSSSTGKKLVPRGTSEYQGRWFVDDVLDEDASDLEEQQEGEGEEEEDANIVDDDMMVEDNMEADDITDSIHDSEMMHVDLSPEEESRQLEEYRSLAKDDLEFPDEIELHPNESAIERLKGFRGVKSLGNCDWDYDEYDPEAPSILKRLFQVSNYKATKNKVNKQFIKQTEITAGNRVRLYIIIPPGASNNVSSVIGSCSSVPFPVYELLEHEHKLGVCNFSFEAWQDYEKPIINKEQIIVQYGPRRQIIQPLYNQANNNPNNVHKLENFVHHNQGGGGAIIATAITPVLFTNSPTLFFKIHPDADDSSNSNGGSVEFVGKGTYLGSDAKRIMVQRVVLTGHPIKIHKRVVTIRYMFFNREDINYFKAVSLFTKNSGRVGFIKESLGTHGYFKANFDGKLTSQDVVAMSLYKRSWPEVSTAWNKFNY
ncbi:pre-rRNA-processing protein TSR1 [Candida albicans P37037]|nr:pre-rRNA-processing protein TSR1 [Candida albicans P37037]